MLHNQFKKMDFPNLTLEKAMELLTGNIYSLDNIIYDACCTIKYISMRKKDNDVDKNNIDIEYIRYINYNGSASREMFFHYWNVV